MAMGPGPLVLLMRCSWHRRTQLTSGRESKERPRHYNAQNALHNVHGTRGTEDIPAHVTLNQARTTDGQLAKDQPPPVRSRKGQRCERTQLIASDNRVLITPAPARRHHTRS